MIPLIGLVLVTLGVSLMVAWWPAVAVVLQGLLVTTLLLVGVIFLLVGVSENRARRQYHAALSSESGEESAEREDGEPNPRPLP